jgi:hypothetical protein
MARRGRHRRPPPASYLKRGRPLVQKWNNLRNGFQGLLNRLADSPKGQRLGDRFGGIQDNLQPLLSRLDSFRDSRLGWLPLLSLFMTFGLMLVTTAFRTSVSNAGDSEWLYWLGLVFMVVPVAARLATVSATREERLALVVILVITLYGLKVIHSPSAFTYSDELVHYANTNQVLNNQRLFGENSILTVTPNYPGLPAATAAISSLSGLSIFTSGLVIIGVARVVIILGLFLIYEKISNSARIAGLGALIYMANSNYLYWSAQFAYESLALPLAVFVIFLLTLYKEPGRHWAIRPAIVLAMLVILAVTVTHHLTSYALATLLGLTALFSTLFRQESRSARYGLWGLALFAPVVILVWSLLVAPGTKDYLLPVIQRAFGAGVNLLVGGGEDSGRVLFESTSADRAPVWEQIVGILSVLILLAATPLGLLMFWRRRSWSAFAWIWVLATLAYFPLQGLRLTGAGWETANRASEFLFVGIGFIISLAFLTRQLSKRSLAIPIISGLLAGILFVGGVISGWPPFLRLAHPYLVEIETPGGERETLEPQGVAAARWAREYLGSGNRMAADHSSARLMQAYGEQYALAGQKYGIHDLFVNEAIASGELEIIQTTGVDYLVFTRPLTRWNQMRGLYYNPAEGLRESDPAFSRPGDSEKFDQSPGVERLLDTGYVVVYEIRGLSYIASAP